MIEKILMQDTISQRLQDYLYILMREMLIVNAPDVIDLDTVIYICMLLL